MISTHFFVLKMVWGISKKRVFLEFLYHMLYFAEWIITAGIMIQLLLDMAEGRITFSGILVSIWGFVLLFLVCYLIRHYFEEIVKPVTDVLLYEGIHQKLYEKACQVDLYCFEDSNFYNQYMMAIRQAQEQFPKVLGNICLVINGFFAAVVASSMLISVDPLAILFLIFPVLGNFIFNRKLIQSVFHMERELIAFQRISDYVNRTVHLAEYAKEMRMFGVFRLLKKQYERSISSMHRTVDRYAGRNQVFYWLMQMFTFTLLFELSSVYAGYRVLVSGTMTFSQMAVFQSIMHSNTWFILNFTENLMTCVKDSLCIGQVQEFLKYEPRIPEDADGEIPERTIRSIEFCHVWFGYQEGKYILKDVCFRIEAGQTLAIAGYNGAGKSTLLKLLLRFYDPEKGTVLVNGRDIRTYQLRAYRALFTSAFQDGKIFADTIQENVLMGRRSTCGEDQRILWRALELAGFAQEVLHLPDGELTLLTREFSRKGCLLSAGQCQKIIAARAFAKDSPIAIFDEPSSALDPIAEHELFKNIQNYSKGKILFFVSHRLSSVQNADMVFFMENGRIKERGSHKELMEADGSYAKLYRIQARNYLASTDV